MYTFINLKHPLRSAIIFYLILFALIMVFRPKLLKNEKNKYLSPLVVLVISIVSYYVFALLNTLV